MSWMRSDIGGRSALRAGVAIAVAMLLAVVLTAASIPIVLAIVLFAVGAALSHAIVHRLGLGSHSDDRAFTRWGDIVNPRDAMSPASPSSDRRRWTSDETNEPGQAAGLALCPPRPYVPLYAYLDHRYASNVVLTFDQIESLLHFPLPTPARTECEWWTDTDAHTAAWAAAGRTATPNLAARTVSFVRS